MKCLMHVINHLNDFYKKYFYYFHCKIIFHRVRFIFNFSMNFVGQINGKTFAQVNEIVNLKIIHVLNSSLKIELRKNNLISLKAILFINNWRNA